MTSASISGLISRERASEESQQRRAELEELRTEPDEPVSILARREELKTLVDDWETASPETRRALVASIFESLTPTQSGGWIAQVRAGWIGHAAAAAEATRVNVCVFGAVPGSRTRNRWFTNIRSCRAMPLETSIYGRNWPASLHEGARERTRSVVGSVVNLIVHVPRVRRRLT